MSHSFRINLRSAGRSKGTAVFVTIVAIVHWLSVFGLVAWIVQAEGPISSGERMQLLLFFGFGFYLAFMARDRWRAIRQPPYIEFGPDRVLLPRGRYGSISSWTAYDSIQSFDVSGKAPLRFCLIGAPGQNFFFAEARFPDQDAFSMFVLELRTRIRNLPEGEKQIALIDHNAVFSRAMWAKPAQVTYALVIILFLTFVLAHRAGAMEDPFRLLRFGANAPRLFAEGQYYRLVTANFLHGGWLHLTLNSMALYSIGSVVERLLGSTRYLILYLVTGVAGAFVSVLFSSAPISVGASTSIYGVLGALFMVNLVYRDRLPAMFLQSRNWWLFILGTSAALPLILPQIGAAAHLGGFGMGLLITYILIRKVEPEFLLIKSENPLIRFMAALIVTITVLSIVVGLRLAGQTQLDDEIQVMSQFIADENTPADELNRFAWTIVADRSASKARRQLAGEAARRAVDKAPDRPEMLDTLASAYFLQGSIDEAIELETEALEKFERLIIKQSADIEADLLKTAFEEQAQAFRNVLRSQRARFELAKFKKNGPPQDAWHIAIRLDPLSEDGKSRKIHLQLDRAPDKGLEIRAVVVRGSLLIGHIDIQLAKSADKRFEYEFRADPALKWAKSARLDVVFVAEKQLTTSRWSAEKYAAEIARLPSPPTK